MKFQCFHAIKFSSAPPVVDRENGMIRGVAIMSIGAAKGHGVLIDGTTLSQVVSSAGKYTSGMPVKFNPATFDHGPGGYVGNIPNSSLTLDAEAGVLRGDIKVLKSAPSAEYVYDLAEHQPDTFGNSLEFDGDPEEVDGMSFARCTELYGVMLVDQPAANSTGLFRAIEDPAKPANKNKTMTDEEMKQFKAAMGEIVAPIATSLAATATGLATLQGEFKTFSDKKNTADDDEDPDDCDMSAEQLASEKMSAGVTDTDTRKMSNRKVNQYRKNKGKPATVGDLETIVARQITSLFRTAGGRSVTPSAKGTAGNVNRFQARVDDLVSKGMKRQNAMTLAIQTSKANGDDYKEFCKERGVISLNDRK